MLRLYSFASKVRESFLDTVSTGSGSDLINDGSRIIGNIACRSQTRSLPLPVLTVSKNDSQTFEAKPLDIGIGSTL